MGRKTTLSTFKRLFRNISHGKTWTWVRKGHFKRETESLPIAAQNNTIRTNHIKARIDKMQQNSRCMLFGDRNETINYIISECSKLQQKVYKTRHNWVGKVIHWEMEFNHTNKWYMQNPESALENESQQTPLGLRDTNGSPNVGRTSRPNYNKKKRTCRIVDFASRLTTE